MSSLLDNIEDTLKYGDEHAELAAEMLNIPLNISKYRWLGRVNDDGFYGGYRAVWDCPKFLEKLNKLLFHTNAIWDKRQMFTGITVEIYCTPSDLLFYDTYKAVIYLNSKSGKFSRIFSKEVNISNSYVTKNPCLDMKIDPKRRCETIAYYAIEDRIKYILETRDKLIEHVLQLDQYRGYILSFCC